jgi:hypothetical protein
MNMDIGLDMDVLYSVDMNMQHRHGLSAWTWACSMDMDVQHGHGHAAWGWTCSIDMDVAIDIDIDMNIVKCIRISI